ncbi:MAG: rod shape-determining protein [Clostridiales bacterium]|nr:rod shape-determining protein [Clostridiales bacterium]
MPGANLGIDLGTENVVIFVKGKGIKISEPCIAAYSNIDGRLLAVGKKAYEMLGRSSGNIKVIKPMKDGVVSDFTVTKHILQYFISRICKNMIFKPNVIVCVPSTVTDLEKRTILELIKLSGAAKARMVEEPLSAALGAGVDPQNAKGTMVVDIGGGTCDIAVVTMGGISVSKSIFCAGRSLDTAVSRQLKRERDIIVGERTAEYIKINVGGATLREVELGMTVKGKDYITNTPLVFEVTSKEVYLAMRPALEEMVNACRDVLELTPPDLASDISDTGIILTGGGAMIKGIDRLFESRLGVKTRVAQRPLDCVALGTGKIMEIIQ